MSQRRNLVAVVFALAVLLAFAPAGALASSPAERDEGRGPALLSPAVRFLDELWQRFSGFWQLTSETPRPAPEGEGDAGCILDPDGCASGQGDAGVILDPDG